MTVILTLTKATDKRLQVSNMEVPREEVKVMWSPWERKHLATRRGTKASGVTPRFAGKDGLSLRLGKIKLDFGWARGVAY